MKKKWIISIYAATTLVAGCIMVAVGCGGGGGAVNSPSSSSAGAAFAALLPPAQHGANMVGNAACAKCHQAESTTFAGSVHAKNAVTCESCHGPGSIHASNPLTTNILTFPNVTQAPVCAQCHAPQANDWATSPHAVPVADPVQSGSNTCLRCHSANFHAENIDAPTSQGVSPTTINTNILALTTAQLTAEAGATVATATCDNCHDPHQNTSNIPAYGQLAGTQCMLRRATSNSDTTGIDAGATVGVYTTYNQLCGSCHNSRGADPSDAALVKNTSRAPFHEGPEMNMLLGITGVVGSSGAPTQGSHSDAPDQCIHCHMPSGAHTFVPNLAVSCAPCHSQADAQAREVAVQSAVLTDLVDLQSRLTAWAQTNYGSANPDSWDYTSNIPTGETVPTQSTVPIQIMESRYNYYYVVLDRSNGVHNAPYTEYLLAYANSELDAIGVPSAAPHAQMSIIQMKALVQPYLQRATVAAERR